MKTKSITFTGGIFKSDVFGSYNTVRELFSSQSSTCTAITVSLYTAPGIFVNINVDIFRILVFFPFWICFIKIVNYITHKSLINIFLLFVCMCVLYIKYWLLLLKKKNHTKKKKPRNLTIRLNNRFIFVFLFHFMCL